MLLTIYKETILPLKDYGCIVWADCEKLNAQHLECLQKQALRIIPTVNPKTCTQTNPAIFKQEKTVHEITNGAHVQDLLTTIDYPHQLKRY